MKGYFFSYIYRMRYITRWGLMKNSSPENLAEHSLDTAVIAHALAVISNKIFNKNVNAERCATVALFHDAPEILTGDLPTPVKYFNPEIKNAYKKVEKNAEEKLLTFLTDDIKAEYETIFQDISNNSEISKIVHYADKLSAYIKCLDEIKSGNSEFNKAANSIKNDLYNSKSDEVLYFLDNFIEGFTLTLDELN